MEEPGLFDFLFDEVQDPFEERYDEGADFRCTLAIAQGRPLNAGPFPCILQKCPYWLFPCF